MWLTLSYLKKVLTTIIIDYFAMAKSQNDLDMNSYGDGVTGLQLTKISIDENLIL